ncbi:MAG TPA: heparan-alpha-glucosaminide N-acetyltransferase [Methanocorpusculum sp.]|nr:heparan-alpha-glucosaminide N-acetyltransferase [Methanocorpusculum sp.]
MNPSIFTPIPQTQKPLSYNTNVEAMGERYWEVDAVRGISLIGMIIFHITSLMVIFHMIFTLDWYYEVCRYIHLGTSIFVIISGVALVLRYGRMAGHSKREYHVAILKRGIEIFLIGIAIAVIASVAIHFFVRDGNYMLFNFLQMMGISMIICIPFLWLGKWNIIPAAILIWAGFAIKSIHTGPIWLLPLGVLPDGMFYPRDYFPLLPWVGVMLLGVAIGSVLYPSGVRRFHIPDAGSLGKAFALVGRHTLAIYLLHLPIIAAILYVIMAVSNALGMPFGYL